MSKLVAIPNGGGAEICMARIRQGMTLRAMAEKSELSPAAISKIERGAARSVRPLSAQKICNALGLPFDDLFTIETRVPASGKEVERGS